MLPFNYTEFINDLTYLVNNNFISMDRIDDAVERILLVKFNLGLFESPLADLSQVDEVGSQVDIYFHIYKYQNVYSRAYSIFQLPKMIWDVVMITAAQELG